MPLLLVSQFIVFVKLYTVKKAYSDDEDRFASARDFSRKLFAENVRVFLRKMFAFFAVN